LKGQKIFNIVYFGSWGRGGFCIDALYKRPDIHIQAVFTQYDPNSKDPYYNLVYDFAVEHNIPVFNIYQKNSKAVNRAAIDYLEQTGKTDLVGVSVAFEKIFKKELLSKLKIINLHPSLLPKYRGPSPEFWAIKNKEEFIGITLHWVNEDIDSGDIIYQQEFKLDYDMPFLEFAEWLNARNSVEVLNNFFDKIEHLDIPCKKQDDLSVYFERLNVDKSFYEMTLNEIHEKLR